MSAESGDEVRLDKYLWACRFYKTRALAREMIDGGKVTLDGHRAKPSKTVKPGMMILLRQGHDQKEVEVLQVSGQRGNATLAQTLYRETDASIQARERAAEQRKLLPDTGAEHRPDKKERRDLAKFRRQWS